MISSLGGKAETFSDLSTSVKECRSGRNVDHLQVEMRGTYTGRRGNGGLNRDRWTGQFA